MEKILCLVGKSGSGKTEIAQQLEEKYGHRFIRSYTTRPKRHDTEDGHIFVSNKEFEQRRPRMVAYTEFGEERYKYGVTIDQIDMNEVYIIDPKGLSTLASHIGIDNMMIVYLHAGVDERARRMLETRGADDALSRIISDETDFLPILYPHITIRNRYPSDLPFAVETIHHLLRTWGRTSTKKGAQ